MVLVLGCGSETKRPEQKVDPLMHLDSLKIRGSRIADLSQKHLLYLVTQSMATGGPVQTIEFCHEKVAGIMDSLARAEGAVIRRISDRPRNPGNRANEEEQNILAYFKQQLQPGLALPDTILRSDVGTIYYKPILLGLEACLQCHGIPGEKGGIQAATLEKLTFLYPQDEARHYQLGELRGAWKIRFDGPQ